MTDGFETTIPHSGKPRPLDSDQTVVYGEGQQPHTDNSLIRRRLDEKQTVLPPAREVVGAETPERVGLRYEQQGELGTGGIGEVLLVHDHDIDRPVAMKRLKPQMNRDDIVARFVREIRTVGRLEHPGVVPVYDVGVDANGAYYFTMKRVAGQGLDALIRRLREGDPQLHATWTFSRRAQLMLSVLEAVGFAHAHGVIHRDLKPANIMIGAHGEVLVLDWGLAKDIGDAPAEADGPDATTRVGGDASIDPDLTLEGDVLGTPAYMAPEQAAGKVSQLDARSDLFSLAAVLYELLTLHHPFGKHETLDAMLDAVQNAPIEFASHTHSPHQGRVPHEYGHLLWTALDRDPDKRFQSAEDFAARLRSAIAGCFAAQCPVTFSKRALLQAASLADRFPRLFVIALLVAPLGLLALAALALIGLQSL